VTGIDLTGFSFVDFEANTLDPFGRELDHQRKAHVSETDNSNSRFLIGNQFA
jgi:hypothetical protein